MGDFLRLHFPGVAAAVSLALTTVLALLSKTYARREELDELKIKLTSLEGQIKALPTAEQLHRVELAVSNLSGDIREIKSSLIAINTTAQLLMEKHLNEKE